MLELLLHCHYFVAVDDARLGFPEVTLPVVPGMEGCHWALRRAPRDAWPKVLGMLLTGSPARAMDAVGWLVDHAGPMEGALQAAWSLANGTGDPARRPVEEGPLGEIAMPVGLPEAGSPDMDAARAAILECVRRSGGVPLSEALEVQATLAADFLAGPECARGVVGEDYAKTMKV
jgi:enoyl-CoA hydratase/carnithine racemase